MSSYAMFIEINPHFEVFFYIFDYNILVTSHEHRDVSNHRAFKASIIIKPLHFHVVRGIHR